MCVCVSILYLADTSPACAVFNYSTPCAFELVLNAAKARERAQPETERERETQNEPKAKASTL